MTKNSELIVMRACGISLYRDGCPAADLRRRRERGALFGSRSACIASSNREADRLNRVIRGLAAAESRRPRPPLDGRPRTATSITTTSSMRGGTNSTSLPCIDLLAARWALQSVTQANRVTRSLEAADDGRRDGQLDGARRVVERVLRSEPEQSDADDRPTTCRLRNVCCRSSRRATSRATSRTPAQHDLRAAQELHRATRERWLQYDAATWCRCSGRSRFRS